MGVKDMSVYIVHALRRKITQARSTGIKQLKCKLTIVEPVALSALSKVHMATVFKKSLYRSEVVAMPETSSLLRLNKQLSVHDASLLIDG